MGDELKFHYVFHGRIIPERADFSLTGGPIVRILQPTLDYDLRVQLTVRKSVVSMYVKSKNEIKDFETVRNFLLDYVRLHTDTYGYLNGYAYDVEITSVTGENNEPYLIFGVGINELTEEKDKRPLSFTQIYKLAISEKYRFLNITLSNLRLAIKYANDTGTFSYRAIESIMQYFNDNPNSKESRKLAWEKMNHTLNLDKSWTEFIADYALDTRHGKTKEMSDHERVSILQKTWKIVDRFLIYAENNDVALDKTKYELLIINDAQRA